MVTDGYAGHNQVAQVSECCGAKDTWGVYFFQIEGEKGYIYIRNGSNGIGEVEVVTKAAKNTYNEQPNPDRLYYEVQSLTALLRKDDCPVIYRRLEVTVEVMEVLENARKKAGIFFPGDN